MPPLLLPGAWAEREENFFLAWAPAALSANPPIPPTSARRFPTPPPAPPVSAMAKAYDHLFKLLLIGDSGVGKTCLIDPLNPIMERRCPDCQGLCSLLFSSSNKQLGKGELQD